MKKILGMGNALTDILLRIENDSVISALDLKKGGMFLIDEPKSQKISQKFQHIAPKMVTGGSASNTINGIAKLGAQAGFFGKVGNDMVGDFFAENSRQNGVEPVLLKSVTPSGHCTVLISPDGERTMATFLGAAAELTENDITHSIFAGYDIFHIEGYLVQNHRLIEKAVKLAQAAGLRVSIDLASFNVVEENLAFLREIVKKYIDIVFANEEEARAFTGEKTQEALIRIAEHADIAIVKTGKNGSLVKCGEKTQVIQPIVANCIDSTGAGDLYAAGFLYGLANDCPLDVCGKIASMVSGKIVEVVGAKMGDEVWRNLKKQMAEF